jgi:hypothetical protein
MHLSLYGSAEKMLYILIYGSEKLESQTLDVKKGNHHPLLWFEG